MKSSSFFCGKRSSQKKHKVNPFRSATAVKDGENWNSKTIYTAKDALALRTSQKIKF